MIKEIEEKRKWISDKLIQYVDIVFGVVVGQSILHYLDLIRNPRSSPFAFLALIVVVITISLSWIGYHKSMYKYPYKVEVLSLKRIRPFTDFIIVVWYTLLLFAVDSLKIDPAKINMINFIFFYVVTFVLYIIDGILRIMEYKDHGASKLSLNLKFLFYYIALVVLYFAITSFTHLNIILINYLALVLCLGLYLRYRLQREPHYPDTKLTLVVDVDGVLADQVTPVLDNINKRFASKYTKEEILLWDQPLPLASTDIKTEIENSHNDPSFVLSMKPIPDAQNVLKELSKYCEITIATHRTNLADAATRKWLKKNNIPYDNYVNTRLEGKGSAKGHILIDDYPKNVLDFTKDGRTGLIFTQPWNKNDQSLIGNDRVMRVNSWKEVLDKIKSIWRIKKWVTRISDMAYNLVGYLAEYRRLQKQSP